MKINKILYFLDFPNGFGGAANTLLKQAEMVREYISDVLITIPLDDNGFTIKEFEERCKQSKLRYTYQKYSVLFTTELVDVISLSEDYTRIEEYIEQYKPDIVHSTQINVCVEMACRKLGIPHVMNIYQCTEYMFQLKYPNIFPHYHICDSIYYLNRWKKRLDLDSVCIRNMCQKIEEKKWAFASDYARLDVVYRFGGIYMDMDVELLKPLDYLLGNKAFFTFDACSDVDLEIFGSESGNSLLKKLMELYDDKVFLGDKENMDYFCQPRYIRSVIKEEGVFLDGNAQFVNNMAFLPRNYLSPLDNFVYQMTVVSEDTIGIHHFNAGWKTNNNFRSERIFKNRKLAEIFEYK